MTWIRWFDDIGMADVATVGGKNASLGEMRRALTPLGSGPRTDSPPPRTPTGPSCAPPISSASIRGSLGATSTSATSTRCRPPAPAFGQRFWPHRLPACPHPSRSVTDIGGSKQQYGANCDVAVRSSATAEDLPEASFAGQQETYLNVHGEPMLLDAVPALLRVAVHRPRDRLPRRITASTTRRWRCRSACSRWCGPTSRSAGVMFSLDTETGFPDAVLITGAYGLGESVVQGTVNPDEFYVFKPTLAKGFRPILQKKLGTKEFKLVYDEGGTRQTRSVPVPADDRERFVLSDDDVLTLARWACCVEEHYSRLRGHADADGHRVGEGRPHAASCSSCRRGRRRSTRSETPMVLERFHLDARGERAGDGPERRREDRPGARPRHSDRRRIWSSCSRARCSSPR